MIPFIKILRTNITPFEEVKDRRFLSVFFSVYQFFELFITFWVVHYSIVKDCSLWLDRILF